MKRVTGRKIPEHDSPKIQETPAWIRMLKYRVDYRALAITGAHPLKAVKHARFESVRFDEVLASTTKFFDVMLF